MSSDAPAWVGRIIQEVSELLGEASLQATCDEPLNSAAATFQLPASKLVNYTEFQEISGSFVRHLYAHGWTPKQRLSPAQARAEAMRLLQRHYQGQAAAGYEAAYLDALNPDFDGMEFVLAQLTQILADKARKQYVRWILDSRMNYLDWPARRQLAVALIGRWRCIDPDSLQHAHPAQMAGYCADLLLAQIASEAEVLELLSPSRNLYRN